MVYGGVVGPGFDLSLAEVLDRTTRQGKHIHVHHTFHGPRGSPVTKELGSSRIFPDFTFGTHVVDVEVDPNTGGVSILRYVACHDVGRAINPQTVEGQISGGVVQGIGSGLLEEVVLEDGVNMTGAFFTYLIPTAAEMPPIEAVVLESGEGLGPFGARGIGEPPVGPCAAAISDAIHDAVGVWLTELPMSPSRVWSALHEPSP
jgi:CO/xanthine dehydrogenase Mo-binding subunit